MFFQKAWNRDLWNREGEFNLPSSLVIEHCTADVSLNLTVQGYLYISPGFPAQSCLVRKT